MPLGNHMQSLHEALASWVSTVADCVRIFADVLCSQFMFQAQGLGRCADLAETFGTYTRRRAQSMLVFCVWAALLGISREFFNLKRRRGWFPRPDEAA